MIIKQIMTFDFHSELSSISLPVTNGLHQFVPSQLLEEAEQYAKVRIVEWIPTWTWMLLFFLDNRRQTRSLIQRMKT